MTDQKLFELAVADLLRRIPETSEPYEPNDLSPVERDALFHLIANKMVVRREIITFKWPPILQWNLTNKGKAATHNQGVSGRKKIDTTILEKRVSGYLRDHHRRVTLRELEKALGVNKDVIARTFAYKGHKARYSEENKSTKPKEVPLNGLILDETSNKELSPEDLQIFREYEENSDVRAIMNSKLTEDQKCEKVKLLLEIIKNPDSSEDQKKQTIKLLLKDLTNMSESF
jgi:hypothetical protein